jgi:serine/threonine protein kinase
MHAQKTNPVEALLLQRLEAQLRSAGAAEIDLDALVVVLQGALYEPALAPEEELALSPTGPATGRADAVDRFLAVRVERALRTSLEIGAGISGLAYAPVAPRVVVHRTQPPSARELELEDASRNTFEPRGPLASTTARIQEAGREGRGVLGIELEEALGPLESVLERALHDRASASGGLRPAPHEDEDPLLGTIFDEKYLILRRIGMGGFGVVYEARDVQMHHHVAIKVLPAATTRTDSERRAFREEARRATRLSHPNIVDWKAFEETSDGIAYFVMELLEGEELAERLEREGRLDARTTGRILLQVLDALRAAHDPGDDESVLHLDLKPKNVYLTRPPDGDESVKVTDFGIGPFLGGEAEAGDAPAIARAPELDADGWELEERMRAEAPFVRSAACTPEYASPEQCAHMLLDERAVELDARADLYSLGAVGFHMLAGEPPYAKPKRRQELLRIKQVIEARKIGSMGVRVPRKLAQFVDRCLEIDREKRFRDSQEAYEVLHRIVHPPIRKGPVAAAALAALLMVATAWILGRGAAHRGLDLYAARDGVEVPLAGTTLYLGPAQTSVSLRVSGLEGAAPIDGLRLVDGRDASAREIPGFRLVPEDDRRVRLSAEAGPGRIQTAAYLEIRRPGRDPQWTVPFEIVWLGESSWRIESAAVADLRGRALDPRGAVLDVRVGGASADLESVRVRCGERTLLASAKTDESAYTLPLAGLGLASGPAELEILATDRSGRTQTQTLPVEVASEPLAIVKASLNRTAVGGRYSISPADDPEIRVATSRKADVSWIVRDENGAPIASGGAKGVAAGSFPVTGLARAREGSSFAGSIEVLADESAYVLHARAAERGIARSRLDFTFVLAGPAFAARLVLPEGGRGLALEPGGTTFVAARELVLHVDRENELPMKVQVVCTPRGRPESALVPEPRFLVDSGQTSAAFPLSLAEDDEYELSVRAWRHDLPDRDPDGDPDSLLETRIVVDTTPARLSVLAPRETIVLRSRKDPIPSVRLKIEDAARPGGEARTPVEVGWVLLSARRDDTPLARGTFAPALPGSEPAALQIPAPWCSPAADRPETTDGRYRVVFHGVDAAGNASAPAELAFEQAVDGPELEITRPVARIRWSRGASGGFEIQVVASDPNGVRRVRGSVRRPGAHDVDVELSSDREQTQSRVSVWTGAFALDDSWSHRAVEVHLEAEDGRGATAEASIERELEVIDRLLPPRVAVAFGERPVVSLCLVPGRPAVPFVFGGRDDAEEERAFAAAGLPPYNSLLVPRSWHVEVDPDEIPSFYLDEHEVSVAEFAGFVDAESGYRDARNWPSGSEPVEVRRAALAAALPDLDGGLPVVDVSWEEASAYAAWVGSACPRSSSGSTRSAAACATDPSRARTRADARTRSISIPRAAATARRGRVAAAATRRTTRGSTTSRATCPSGRRRRPPALDEDKGPAKTPSFVREDRRVFLDPRQVEGGDARPRYWVAGGSFETARADFSVVDRRDRAWHGRSVGFRCAADTSAAVDSPAGRDRPTFKAIFR